MAGPFKLIFQQEPALPRLAWFAEVNPPGGTVQVLCGPWVECQETFFVEGAWSGEFLQGDFSNALWFMGSGAKLTADGIRFSTASHPVELIYYVRVADRWLLSNSLPFLLAKSGLQLRDGYPHYASILMSPRFGKQRFSRKIPTSGPAISMQFYTSLAIDRHGTLTEEPRPEPADFRDFHDYKAFLVKHLSMLWSNAKDFQRKQQYGLISTISTGYDSPACAALAKQVGGTETFTFCESIEGEDDSGAAIARKLGMQVREFHLQDAWSNSRAMIEFAAVGDGDFHLAACEEVLAGKLCLTGFFGDTLWGKKRIPPWNYGRNANLVRADYGGGSFTEFRLRVGFIHVPFAMIGMTHDLSIWNITHSEEMQPWSLGTKYDRPIPRRIVEEAGVPRDLFGQAKKVTAINFELKQQVPEQREMSADYQKYLAAHGHFPRWRATLHNAAARLLYFYRQGARVLDRKGLLPARLRMPTYIAPQVPIRFVYRVGDKSFIAPWAIAKLRDKYSQVIAATDANLKEGSNR